MREKAKPPGDREAIRMLAIEVGVREAARRCGLSEDRVRKWSSRYKWLEQRAPKQQEASVTVVTNPGDVLLATHKELGERTKLSLARAAERMAAAAEHAPLREAGKMHEVAKTAALVHKWDRQQHIGLQLNVLNVDGSMAEAAAARQPKLVQGSTGKAGTE